MSANITQELLIALKELSQAMGNPALEFSKQTTAAALVTLATERIKELSREKKGESCPICKGKGIITRPSFAVPSTSIESSCRTCKGTGFLSGKAHGLTLLTFSQFREANKTRCLKWHPKGINSWSSSDWITAIVGELGELASLIKMRNRERDGLTGNKFSPTDKQVAQEAADVFTYLDLFCEANNIDLGNSVEVKFNEVSERNGFPDRIIPHVPEIPKHLVLNETWFREVIHDLRQEDRSAGMYGARNDSDLAFGLAEAIKDHFST